MIDRNGYAPSIVQEDVTRCFLCQKSNDKLDRHEIFGASNRTKSKRLGLWVMLCHSSCHLGSDGVHQNAKEARYLRQIGQIAAMSRYGWTKEQFIDEIGRNYL